MDERELKALFRDLQRQAPDAARLADLAEGGQAGDDELLRLARTPGAAAAYRIARDSRADARVLEQALAQGACAPSKTDVAGSARRPAWHYAIAASAALFAVALVVAPQWRGGGEPEPAIAGRAPAAEVPPLFAGSFEDGRGEPAADGEREIFNAGFDS